MRWAVGIMVFLVLFCVSYVFSWHTFYSGDQIKVNGKLVHRETESRLYCKSDTMRYVVDDTAEIVKFCKAHEYEEIESPGKLTIINDEALVNADFVRKAA